MQEASLLSDVEGEGQEIVLAPRLSRLLASLIDSLTFLPGYLIVFLEQLITESTGTFTVIGYVFMIGVFILQCVLLSRDGQTIGKKMLRIRIVNTDTEKNGGFVPNVLLRYLLNGLISWLTCSIYGFVDVLFIFRGDRRCLHDFIAGTHVIEA
jgi:uncharacterized RDD family membrane protein YckC